MVPSGGQDHARAGMLSIIAGPCRGVSVRWFSDCPVLVNARFKSASLGHHSHHESIVQLKGKKRDLRGIAAQEAYLRAEHRLACFQRLRMVELVGIELCRSVESM